MIIEQIFKSLIKHLKIAGVSVAVKTIVPFYPRCQCTSGEIGRTNINFAPFIPVKNIGFGIPIIIDDTATVERNVTIGEGTYIGKGSVINTDAYIGKMCIVNTGAIIEHESRINDYTHVAVGAVLCGGVQVGRMSLIGANATVIQNLKIGNRCIVGAGTVITKNMGDNEMRYGSKCLNSPGY